MGSFLSALRLAARSISRNKLRATLTMLGILVGIAAVVTTTALGSGARGQISEQIAKLGVNSLIVLPQANQASGARGSPGSGGRLSEDDAKVMVRDSTSVASAAPFVRSFGQLVFEDRNVASLVMGTTRPYFQVRDWAPARGGLWEDAQEQVGERILVLGATPARDLFGPLDPVGRSVRLGKYPYRIVGVLEAKGQSPFGTDLDDIVLMPITTFRSHVMTVGRRGVHGIVASATRPETVNHAKAQVEAILRQRHGIGEGKEPDFAVRTQSELRASQDAIYQALSMLLLLVGAVSLVVGGIGIMNIMLVSVAERTREIGLRMAIGARERDIMLQFVVEAVVLSFMGGVLGTATAVGIVVGVGQMAGFPMHIEPMSLVIALITSSLIGVTFGFYPARRAARLDPIVALGRE